jgi:hypothetical protein
LTPGGNGGEWAQEKESTMAKSKSSMKLALLSLILTALISAVRAGSTDPVSPPGDQPAWLVGLQAKDKDTRDKTVDSVLLARKEMIKKLLTVVDPGGVKVEEEDSPRVAAIYLLGELRAEEAVPLLSKMLTDPLGPSVFTRVVRYGDPVGGALEKIGRPAVPGMIENIETTDDGALRAASLGVLSHVLGGTKHVLELLDKLKARARDGTVIKRIEAARAYVEKNFKEEEPLY